MSKVEYRQTKKAIIFRAAGTNPDNGAEVTYEKLSGGRFVEVDGLDGEACVLSVEFRSFGEAAAHAASRVR